MEQENLKLLSDVNHTIIKFRGVYSEWSGRHGISYNEMLVLYTIRENSYCTQKQICENYLLPKQTIHNVIARMRKAGYLVCDESHNNGREKAFVLSQKGKAYAACFMESLDSMETRALETLGKEKLQALTQSVREYSMALYQALDEPR
ncbi:MAG: MarR family winged helix-turn-helix transcriptional regulator [Eubacteriales bacterium]|nr:MarR family winged helix-turn-helix transcriptional regulator [Eubacteriales bacterium]